MKDNPYIPRKDFERAVRSRANDDRTQRLLKKPGCAYCQAGQHDKCTGESSAIPCRCEKTHLHKQKPREEE